MIIRPIKKSDNREITAIIRSVLIETGVPKVGTTYEDSALEDMYSTYQEPRSAFFVIEDAGKLIGGGGISPLANYSGNVCELQKMYYLPEARGKGLGKKVLELCLEAASNFNFDQCYLETMPYMKAAMALYEKYGFRYLDGPMGDTGHYQCPIHMIKDL